MPECQLHGLVKLHGPPVGPVDAVGTDVLIVGVDPRPRHLGLLRDQVDLGIG